MVVPYANRAAVATLPTLALAIKPATVKELIADFATQCPHESVLESVQLIKGRTLRVVFPSSDVMEEIVTGGLAFRSHQIQFKTPSIYKWVTLMDLPYGISEGEIKTALSKFGQAAHVKSEVYMGLYTGTRLVKMEVKKPIPSRVMVAGHLCTIFYRGQVRSCFRCNLTGHEAKNCPSKQNAPHSSGQSEENHDPPSNDTTTPNSGEGMSTDPPSSPKSFAEVVATPGDVSSPSREGIPLLKPTEGMNTTPPTSPPESSFRAEVLRLPSGPTDVAFPSVTSSEWTDSEGSDQTQTQPETTVDDNPRDRSPLSKAKPPAETETLTPAVSANISPDIITSSNDASIPDGQLPHQPIDQPSSISNYGSEPVWTDWVVEVSPEIPDGQPKKQLTEDLPLMDTSTPSSNSGESSSKAGSLKTRRKAHYPVHQKGKLASCIRQRTAPTLPGKRKAKHQPPPDSPYTPLVTDSGYLITSTPGGFSIDRPKRPVIGAVGAVSLSPSSAAHP